MKRRILFSMLAVVLALGLALPVAAHTESDPQVQALYAGQDIDVGTVSVWNDADNLYVEYEITDLDWVITETHLYAGKNVPPTTAPGQFPYDDDDATSVSDTVVAYTIPLADIDSYSMKLNKKGKPTGVMVADGTPGVESCNDVYIAAHAVVEKTDTFNECLVSGADSDMVLYLTEDSSNPGYPTGYSAPYQSYAGTPISSVLAWTHSAWGPYGVSGAEWISSSYYAENTDYNTWRLFTRSFDLPADASNIAGTLTMNCDNAQLAHLNDSYVGEDTYAPATIVYGVPVPPSGNAHGWNSVESWDISSHLTAGSNELWTMTRNYAWPGGPTTNPTGLIYKLCYWYDVVTTETAWANGTDFEQANWAMYFTYHIQEPPPCPFPLVGNTKDIDWGLRVPEPVVAYPNDAPVTFSGTVNASGVQDNGAVFVGLVDKDYVDDGNSGWMGGAYIYFGRSGNNLRVGPTDGNFGGEIVQTFRTYADYFSSPTLISFTMVIDNGSITVTLDSTDYVDTYGEIKALNSKTAYAWDEFESGAYIAVDTWPYGSYGVNDASYDILVDWCHE